MKFSAHPLWLVGFRPFFCLACLSGLSLPVIWSLIFSGLITAPANSFSSTQWHAHEMFFGFGWAVLGGFLLTSTKNWVNKRGFHGNALVFLAAVWIIERFGMWFEGALPALLFRISNNLFLGSIVGMLIWTLLRYRKDDSYPDNYFFLIILPLFLLAKNLMLSTEYFQIGSSMTLGLFRMAFLVMLERTLNTFMRGAFQTTILTNPTLNKSIKLLGLVLVFESLIPPQAATVVALLLATLLIGRFFFWKPHLALQRLDVGIMYLGYMAIVGQLLIGILPPLMHPVWVGSVSVHVFTFGAMGLIIPAMMIRISNGHTGRKVAFDTYDKTALRIMIFGFVVRIIAPQLYPDAYLHCIALAAACWFACFAMLAWRYIPYLVRARADGKEH